MIKACVAGENCRPDDSQNRIEGRIGGEQPHMHIAAIDNSLAFPHSHPLGWRTYTYGWLYLPVALIGRPFSDETRQHYLPLLSSPKWWAQTTCELRNLFKTDPGFQEKMFRKQIAVMKGQALNLVESLKNPSDGVPFVWSNRYHAFVDYAKVQSSSAGVRKSWSGTTSSECLTTNQPVGSSKLSSRHSTREWRPEMSSLRLPP